MPFAARSLPLLAPQNDAAPSGGAKKKNKKKKSAAAKANAAEANATSPTEATVPATSTDDPEPQEKKTEATHETQNGADDEPSKASKDAPVKPDTDATSTTESTETPSTPTKPSTNGKGKTNGNDHARNGSTTNGYAAIPLHLKTDGDKDSDKDAASAADRNGDGSATSTAPSSPTSTTADSKTDSKTTNQRPMTTPQEQDGPAEGVDEASRAELERLRKQVEELQKAQESHDEEIEKLKGELEESEAGREQAETQYQTIVVRVEKIKETLGSRFQRDKEELAEARDRIEELEAQNEELLQSKADAEASTAAAANEVARLQRELENIEHEHDREQSVIRNHNQLSQQNWHREKEDMLRQLESLTKELASTKAAMNDWEVVALEERSKYTATENRVADYEEQIQMLREQYEQAANDRDAQAQAVDSLQRSLNDIQDARRHELREIVQDSEAKLEAAENRAQAAEKAAEKAKAEAEELQKVADRAATLEEEIKEKSAIISKIRHDQISINEHLSKALRFIRRVKPDQAIDRQVMTNLLLQFLHIDRSDPKKFQVLQIIAGTLHWTDEEKERAGLARPGTSSSSLRLPSSPFGRTPSTPSLNTEFMLEGTPSGSSGGKSLSTMFTEFLEESVNETSSAAVPSDDPLLKALLSTKPRRARGSESEASSSRAGPSSAAGPSSEAGPSGTSEKTEKPEKS